MADKNNNTPTLNLPNNMEIGTAIADGSCFFDSFRQGLGRLGIRGTISDLRNKCKEFAETNPPDWFIIGINNSYQANSVRRETVPEYIENILRRERWGDPDIEGRILCKCYEVHLYVIERQQTAIEVLYTYQIIDQNGPRCVSDIDFDKRNTIFIVNQGQNHFEPIINKIQQRNIAPGSDYFSKQVQINPEQNDSAEQIVLFRNVEDCNKLETARNSIAIRLVNDTFCKIEDAIKRGDIKYLNKLVRFLHNVVWYNEPVANICKDKNNLIRKLHYMTMACKNKRPLVLYFLLHSPDILCISTDLDTSIINNYQLEALCESIQSLNFDTVGILYDKWSSDVNWLESRIKSDNETVIKNLKQLNILLAKAHNRVYDIQSGLISSPEHVQMSVNVQCLIHFNIFQTELCAELSNLKTHSIQHANNDIEMRKNEVKSIIAILITALNIYEKYSNRNITKDIDLKHVEKHLRFGHNEAIICPICYMSCEVYYRRLDYHIAQLIINNIHFLKLRLSMYDEALLVNAYQHIETHIYYYLYCDSEVYFPQNIPKYRKFVCSMDDRPNKFLPYDSLNAPVVFREWLLFKKSIGHFRTSLEIVDIDESLRKKDEKLPEDEINNLWLAPLIRDDYSLKKILQYLRKKIHVDFNTDKENSVLIIQRIIQILGEFIKGTPKSCHLSPLTLALLQAEIPRQVYNQILTLRDDLAHIRDGKLIRRIDLEINESKLFEEVFKDFREIENAITEVIQIYKPILENKIFEIYLKLIASDYLLLTSKIVQYNDALNEINMFYNNFTIRNFNYELHEQMEKELAESYKITVNYMRSIAMIVKTKNNLDNKVNQCTKQLSSLLKATQFKYTKSLQESIDFIEGEHVIWQSIQKDLSTIQFPSTVIISDYPSENSIKSIRQELKNIPGQRLIKSKILKSLKTVKDRAAEWEQAKQMVEFMSLRNDINETKHKTLVDFVKYINDDCPNNTGIHNIRKFLVEYEKYYSPSATSTTTQTNNSVHEYKGLKTLAAKMSVKFFLTKNETDYLKNNTNDICQCRKENSCIHLMIIKKLYASSIINENEQSVIETLNIGEKTRKIISNLSNGKKRSSNTLECLVNRTNHLSSVMEGERELCKLVLRYRHDEKFKMLIEILTFDIMNIHIESGLKTLININYTKLMREYPLRNLLAHGNALLDICSSTIDENDYPTAIITFALNIVKDEGHLQSLFELYQAGVSHADVKLDSSDNLDGTQKKLVNHFKESAHCATYVKLMYK